MDCYKIMNLNDFDKMNVPQVYDNKNFQNVGNVSYCVFKGKNYGLIWKNELLVVGTNGVNPVESKHNSAYIDDNRDLWVGVKDDS